MPRPFTPLVITSFRGENDTIPSTEIDDQQAALCRNLYLVQGGLERRLGVGAVSSSLGANAVQGLKWCMLDPALAGADVTAADGTGGSLGALLDPMDATVVSNLHLYLRADQTTVAGGAAVATWPDLSAFARDATQGTGSLQPIARDAISPNGLRRMLEWDGADDYMAGTLPGAGTIDVTGGCTVYIYVKEDALDTAAPNLQRVWETGQAAPGSSSFGVFTKSGSYQYELDDGLGGVVMGSTQLGYQLLTAVRSSGATPTYSLYRDGTLLGSYAGNTNLNDIRTYYRVGNGAAEGIQQPLDGLIGCLLIYNIEHDTATRQAIERWILDHYEG